MPAIRSVCPKCGKQGTQRIWVPNKKYSYVKYLRFQHGEGKYCIIGRVQSEQEAFGVFNEPQTVEEYQKVIEEIVAYAKSLVSKRKLPAGGRIRLDAPNVVRDIKTILDKYGLWS